MVSVVLFLSFFILLILNVPISLCLGLSSVCAILYSGTSLTIVATNMYSGISKFLLLAIPFFVMGALAGMRNVFLFARRIYQPKEHSKKEHSENEYRNIKEKEYSDVKKTQ